MANADIKATARARAGKGAARAVRREGKVPGVVYGGDQARLNRLKLEKLRLKDEIARLEKVTRH